MDFGLIAMSHNLKKLIKAEVRPNLNDNPTKAAKIPVIVENKSIFAIEINFQSKVDMRNTKFIRNNYFDYNNILLSIFFLNIRGAA